MVTHMKTTVEIADPLLREAKARAREDGTTLKELIEAGLRKVLGERKRGGKFKLRDASVSGKGLQADLREGSWERVRDLIYQGRGT